VSKRVTKAQLEERLAEAEAHLKTIWADRQEFLGKLVDTEALAQERLDKVVLACIMMPLVFAGGVLVGTFL
jgi:hypothetical protein